MSDQKPPFVFHNYPLFFLLKLIAASPLDNSYPQKKKSFMTTFVVFMFFSAYPHLHARLHFPWFYVAAGVKIRDHLQKKLSQGSHVFLQSNKNISCTRSICAEVSGDFHPNFHYKDSKNGT